jgi:arylsulfatase A-like enzyme
MSTLTIQANNRIDNQPKPNILYIMADDLGCHDVGFMGSKWFETPNLDKLAKKSAVFTQAYMYPTSSPSRTCILTGKQSFRTGVYTVPVLEKGDNQTNIFSRWTVGREHTIYAEPLKKAGYKTIHLGKWHIVGPYPEREKSYPFKKKLTQPKDGDIKWIEEHKKESIKQFYPTQRGFDENVGGTFWGDPARGYKKGYKSKSGGYFAPFKNPYIKDKQTDFWLTDRLTDDAIDFIDRNKNKPFFVNLDFYAPHMPTKVASEKWLQKFLKKNPDEFTGQGKKRLEEIAAYATMVQSIDENVGRIIDYLEKNKLVDNTVIIFTSDNGYNGRQSQNDNLRGNKGMVYEGGIRVPLLISWGNNIKTRIIETPVCGLDFFPTFMEFASINYQGVLDGKSLIPLIKGGDFQKRPLFWHIASRYKNPPCSIIRYGKWKLIQFLLDGRIELYDLENDLKETTNLINVEKDVASKLKNRLIQWRKRNNIPLPPASILGDL